MLLSEFINHLQERLIENGDAPVVFDDNSDVDVPDFNSDPELGNAYVIEHP